MANIHGPAPYRNPSTRSRIAALFKLEYSDEEIAETLDISNGRMVATRIAMGLRRPRNPNPQYLKPVNGKPKPHDENTEIIKKHPVNSNARINQFAVLRAYLDQDVKNMADVARRFKCSRNYVSRVIMLARGTIAQPGILNERNQLYIADTDELLDKIMKHK